MNIKAQENIQRKQFFDYNWKFFLGDSPSASALDFDDKTWRNLDLPHDWSIEGKLDPKNPMGGAGGYFPAGVGWYRKSFSVPSAWKDK
ncbi:MAG: beta-galactosidase, partial [Ignavibacteria bacterium]